MTACHFVLLAGGSGSRLGGGVPKQFRELAGLPVLAHSLRSFGQWSRDGGVVIVSREDYLDRARALLAEHLPDRKKARPQAVVAGGPTRHQSTLRGVEAALNFAKDDDVLFLHDAARPCLTGAELDALARAFREHESCNLASLVSPLTDTIVRGVSGEDRIPLFRNRLERSELFAVKTPQASRVSAVKELIKIPESDSFTDLLSWGEAASIPGFLIEASPYNHKLTTPEDYGLLEFYLKICTSEKSI